MDKIEELQQLLEQEQRRRKAAELAQQGAERARQEAERAQQEAELAQQEGERALRKTTLPEFLDACHTNLYLGLTVQTDASLSTQGDPSNANHKVRPEKICSWEEFPTVLERIWKTIVISGFMQERHFTSINTLQENGEGIRRRMLSSELDLHHFERWTVEDPVSLIISKLYENVGLRDKFNLKGLVKFENHSNTLSPDSEIESGIQRMNISGQARRRSPRLANGQGLESNGQATATAPSMTSSIKLARPRADQFCVYNTSSDVSNTDSRIAVFIVEYKPPHKLTLGHIYEGLEDMSLEDVVNLSDTDGPKQHCRRLVAATITQAFSYMIQAGLEYGCVRNGEACIFLRISEDPRVAYYFLSVPKGDVGESTGWQSEGDDGNRLHLTAVGQMLAFTLLALRKTSRSHSWRLRALDQLPKWEIVYEDLLEAIPADDAPSSEYRPPREDSFLRVSPIRLRNAAHRQKAPSCNAADDARGDDSRSDDSDIDTPSRRLFPMSHQSTSKVRKIGLPPYEKTLNPSGGQQYCTHACLRGLVDRGALDRACPNVREHGDRHQIDKQTFLGLVRQQLSERMDENFEPIGQPGSRGVPFIVKLASHGYTLVAKCTPSYFARCLEDESAVYSRLRPIQGVHVPVHLGVIELPQPYFYEGIAVLSEAMLLSFGGTPVHRHLHVAHYGLLANQARTCLEAIGQFHVKHEDFMPRNILRHPGTAQMVVVDFERAKMRPFRLPLSIISPNRKRKQDENGFIKFQSSAKKNSYPPEIDRLIAELRRLAITPSNSPMCYNSSQHHVSAV